MSTGTTHRAEAVCISSRSRHSDTCGCCLTLEHFANIQSLASAPTCCHESASATIYCHRQITVLGKKTVKAHHSGSWSHEQQRAHTNSRLAAPTAVRGGWSSSSVITTSGAATCSSLPKKATPQLSKPPTTCNSASHSTVQCAAFQHPHAQCWKATSTAAASPLAAQSCCRSPSKTAGSASCLVL